MPASVLLLIETAMIGLLNLPGSKMPPPFLAELPLDPQVRIGGDSGRPITLNGETDSNAAGFIQLAKTMIEGLAASGGPKGPSITIED